MTWTTHKQNKKDSLPNKTTKLLTLKPDVWRLWRGSKTAEKLNHGDSIYWGADQTSTLWADEHHLLRTGNSQPRIVPSGQKALFPYTRYSEIRLLYIRSVRSCSTTRGSGGLQHPVPIRRRTIVSPSTPKNDRPGESMSARGTAARNTASA